MKPWRERLAELRAVVSVKASRGADKIFNVLTEHARMPDLYCWPSIRTLCEKTGLARRTVYYGLGELVRLGVLHQRGMIERARGRRIPNIYRLGREVEEIPERCKWKAVLDVKKPIPERRNRRAPSKSQQQSLKNGARCKTVHRGRVQNGAPGRVQNGAPLEVKRSKEGRRVGFGQSVKSVSSKKSRKALRRTAKRKPQRKPFSFFSGRDGLTDLTKDSAQEKDA